MPFFTSSLFFFLFFIPLSIFLEKFDNYVKNHLRTSQIKDVKQLEFLERYEIACKHDENIWKMSLLSGIADFAGNKKKFDKPVLVNVDTTGVWRVGFITQPSTSEFGLPDHVTVYVPHSYAISGITYIVPKTNIRILDNVSAADAMKYTVSGGVTDVHDDTITTDFNQNETA